MSERYRNIFCYYRGPQHADQTEKVEALENNITKALINTLDLCPRLGREFIRWLDEKIERRTGGVRLDADSREIYWGILETPDKERVNEKDTRIMLGIKRRNSTPFNIRTGTTRPKFDGVIEGSDWLIGIESKIDGMNTYQFEQEKGWLDTENDLTIDWQEIHEFLSRLGEGQCTKTEKLFIQQFTGYLKEIGQLPFQGLKKEHFDFLTKDKSEREKERLQIRDLMNTLGADLWDYKDKSANFRELYEGAWDWVKGLNKNNNLDYAELKFYLSSGKSIDNQCYLGISLDSEYADILSVYAWLGPENMFGRLVKVLQRDKNALCRMLKDKNLDGYAMQLFDNNGKWLFERTLCKRRDSRLIRSYLLGLEESIVKYEDTEGLSFALATCFKKDSIVGLPALSAKDQLKKIAKAMKALHPFMQFVNKVK